MKVIVLRGTTQAAHFPRDTVVLPFEELKKIRRGEILRMLLRYEEAGMMTSRMEVLARPFLSALMVRALGRRNCRIEDEEGKRQNITAGRLATLFCCMARDALRIPLLLRAASREVERLFRREDRPAFPVGRGKSWPPLYLRTDLSFGIRSGGSIAHIAGVLNHLDRFAGKPVFLTTDVIPTVRADLETFLLQPDGRFRDFREIPAIAFNFGYEDRALRLLAGRKTAFVYQRYSVDNYAGVRLARRLATPFVLEYNGSEVWIHRNWGKPLRYEALAERIERLNLEAADLIVVVSRAMKDELLARGIDAEKILVNPNGVDPERYSPGVDGSGIRKKYGLDGKLVVGFIGTFGKWHGAEMLAEAFGRLLREFPSCRDGVRLLMIGDGVMMPEVRRRIERNGAEGLCVLPGMVAQEEGPAHLAACDILASPHVPNPDGTPFFGSPTKLFEYMAMGKGIVASDLDQIGEVLRHERTAWLVPPGDPDALAAGLKRLIDDEDLRNRLGRAAREEVAGKYTWEAHTGRIIEALEERCR